MVLRGRGHFPPEPEMEAHLRIPNHMDLCHHTHRGKSCRNIMLCIRVHMQHKDCSLSIAVTLYCEIKWLLIFNDKYS